MKSVTPSVLSSHVTKIERSMQQYKKIYLPNMQETVNKLGQAYAQATNTGNVEHANEINYRIDILREEARIMHVIMHTMHNYITRIDAAI